MKRSEQYFLQTQTDFNNCWDLADWNNDNNMEEKVKKKNSDYLRGK
jgi:hypothetical protein